MNLKRLKKKRLSQKRKSQKPPLGSSAAFNNKYTEAVHFYESGRMSQAAAACREIVQADPNHADAMHLIGAVALHENQYELAETIIAGAVNLQPQRAIFHNSLGLAKYRLHKLDEALQCYQVAVQLGPDPEVYNNIGSVHHERFQFEEALDYFVKALQLAPKHFGALNNRAGSLQNLGRLDEAISCYQEALQIKNDSPELHMGLSSAYFRKGDYQKAWNHYEWRWLAPDSTSVRRVSDKPEWKGEDLTGKTILLDTEQGFGDAIQYCRFLPFLVERAASVLVECREELVRLFQGLPSVTLVRPGDEIPAYDVHCPLLSVPRFLGIQLETVPARTPYLDVSPEVSNGWRKRLGEFGGKKIGFVWAGRPSHSNDRNRSIATASFLPLLGLEGGSFFSLQAGGKSREMASVAEQIHDLSPQLIDFSETAGALLNLDLIITVDTAVAHLAGALARPVWVLLPFFPDPRWFLDRRDSPWYPSMRLFRQSEPGNWESVFGNVKHALAGFLKS